ncbi:MAG TPA: hypothetical protein VGF48_18200 [Thermoanaerobaculia bacterium]|jgi:hypothetical protein
MGRLTPKSRAWLFALAAFALALLPRLSPLLAGTLFADDFVHLPRGHLESYRFLNWGELALWQWLFGPAYLQTIAPKIIGALYTAVLLVLLRAFLLRVNLPAWPMLLVPLHPLWNVFVAWNVCAVYVLSLVLIAGGYLLLMRDQKTPGVVLIALGVSGYQVHAGLLPALWLLDRNVRRAAFSAGGVLLYLISTKIAALTGLTTWGGRGMSFENVRAQLGAAIDNLAVMTQPLLSFYGSEPIAWRFWWLPFVIVAVLLRRSAVHLAAPAVAALVILPLNVAPTGPRVAAAIWIALLLAMIPLLRNRLAAAALALLLIPITLADAHNRTVAWRIDQATRAAMRGEIVIAPGTPARFEGRPIVMQNFNAVTPRTYSNVINWPEWYLGRVRRVDGLTLERIDGQTPFASWMYEGNTTYVLVR